MNKNRCLEENIWEQKRPTSEFKKMEWQETDRADREECGKGMQKDDRASWEVNKEEHGGRQEQIYRCRDGEAH